MNLGAKSRPEKVWERLKIMAEEAEADSNESLGELFFSGLLEALREVEPSPPGMQFASDSAVIRLTEEDLIELNPNGVFVHSPLGSFPGKVSDFFEACAFALQNSFEAWLTVGTRITAVYSVLRQLRPRYGGRDDRIETWKDKDEGGRMK